MMELVKSLGRGILYTVLSPFYAAFFVLVCLYNILVYLAFELSGVVMFFLGKSFNDIDYETSLLNEKKAEIRSRKNQSLIQNKLLDSREEQENEYI